MQFWISVALMPLSMPTALARMIIGVMLATNIARMCCRPNGNACLSGTLPSSSYMLLMI